MLQAYEQLGRDFDAAVNQKDSRDPSNLIRLSVEVRRSMEVGQAPAPMSITDCAQLAPERRPGKLASIRCHMQREACKPTSCMHGSCAF